MTRIRVLVSASAIAMAAALAAIPAPASAQEECITTTNGGTTSAPSGNSQRQLFAGVRRVLASDK